MGVFGHNDLFSRKYTTAVIRDSQDRGYFIHLKTDLDGYFITKLNNTFYAFSLDNARYITHRNFGIKTFKWVDFDTTHYLPIQFDKLEELKLFLVKNSLPRMNMLQHIMIKTLGRKERKKEMESQRTTKASLKAKRAEGKTDEVIAKEITIHDVNVLLQELAQRQTEFPEETANLINYIQGLDIDHIVTPCRKISEYIEDDLIATKPSFLGELIPRLSRLQGKHSEITNLPYGTKSAWMMKVMILGFVVVGIAMIAWMADAGYFNEITKLVPDTSQFKGVGDAFSGGGSSSSVVDKCSDQYLQDNYSPEQLKAALDNGSVTCKLSPTLQSSVDGASLPKAAPIP